MAHACNLSTLGGRGGQTIRGQKFEISLANMGDRVRLCLKKKKKKKSIKDLWDTIIARFALGE